MRLAFGSFLIFISLASSTIAGPKEDVSATTAKWIEAIGENSADKVVALYAKDGVLWGTSSPTVRSDPAAIRGYFEGVFKGVPGINQPRGSIGPRVWQHRHQYWLLHGDVSQGRQRNNDSRTL